MVMSELQGKVAMVVGASRIKSNGRSVALALADAGADVVVCGRADSSAPSDEERAKQWRGAESIAEELIQRGRRSMALRFDVARSGEADQAVARVIAELGAIDILVYCTAYGMGPDRVPVVELDEAVWNEVIAVNLTGAYLVCKAVAKAMIARGQGGKIVTVGSIKGRTALPAQAAYCASKFALNGFTQSLAHELAAHNINVNVAAPGATVTSRVERHMVGPQSDRALAEIPLGRYGVAEEVAELVLFLCSPRASYITGAVVPVSGGWMMD
jgi:NAD(P)-dependent dehydrogenase (short-subunit alcohol dehydrogenase family)